MKTILLLSFFVMVPRMCLAQDTSFVPFVTYESSNGNYIISYDRDPSTGRTLQAVLVPRTKISPKIGVQVTRLEARFVYHYTVGNGPGAKQDLMSFDLGIRSPLDSAVIPMHWFDTRYEYEPFLQFGHDFQCDDVAIGRSVEFTIISKDMPGVILSRFRGRTDSLNLAFEGEPSAQVQFLIDSLMSLAANRYVGQSTVGPVPTPLDIIPIAFLDTLIAHKHRALALAWITNEGVANSLDQKLNNARQQLERGNNKSAMNILEAFVNEVEALNKQGKQITSEAFALLKYNAEYLISQLQ